MNDVLFVMDFQVLKDITLGLDGNNDDSFNNGLVKKSITHFKKEGAMLLLRNDGSLLQNNSKDEIKN